MATLWRRAMVYLGLQDDDEFAYDTDYEYGDHDDADHGVGRATPDPRELRDPRPHELAEPRDAVERSSTVRPVARDDAHDLAPQRPSVERVPAGSPRVHVVEPRSFNDVQEVGDRVKANQPVILNLQGRDRELQRRLIDFSSGLAYAVGGHMERVNDQVFLLRPGNVEVAPAEKERLQARGLYRS